MELVACFLHIFQVDTSCFNKYASFIYFIKEGRHSAQLFYQAISCYDGHIMFVFCVCVYMCAHALVCVCMPVCAHVRACVCLLMCGRGWGLLVARVGGGENDHLQWRWLSTVFRFWVSNFRITAWKRALWLIGFMLTIDHQLNGQWCFICYMQAHSAILFLHPVP